MQEEISKKNVLYTRRHLVTEICAPLRKINTYGFILMRHFNNGQFLWLCNEFDWAVDHFLHRYMQEKYSIPEMYQPFLTDSVDLWSLSKDNIIWQEGRNNFGFGNGISLYFRRKNYIDICAFYTKEDYYEMNGFYINNINLLKKFACYFVEC